MWEKGVLAFHFFKSIIFVWTRPDAKTRAHNARARKRERERDREGGICTGATFW